MAKIGLLALILIGCSAAVEYDPIPAAGGAGGAAGAPAADAGPSLDLTVCDYLAFDPALGCPGACEYQLPGTDTCEIRCFDPNQAIRVCAAYPCGEAPAPVARCAPVTECHRLDCAS